MNRKIETALDDISLIKKVIERTQKDFSKVSMFFIWVGIINAAVWALEQMAYFFRNTAGYSYWLTNVLGQSSCWFRLIGYIILFIIFYRKIKTTNNEISEGMIKIWGIVLIGSNILLFLYISLMPVGNSEKIIMLWKCKELIEIIPVIFALFMTGILTRKNIVTACTAIYSIVYFVLFFSMKEVPYGTLGGAGTTISISSASIKYLMIYGMIVLGIVLKIGAKNDGDKCNTRGISDEN